MWVEGQGRLLGSSIFPGYFQLTACALNDVSAVTELFDTLPNLSFPIQTRFSGRRKGYFIETLDRQQWTREWAMYFMDLQGEVPEGGEWTHTVHEGEQEEAKRVFAETLQSQES